MNKSDVYVEFTALVAQWAPRVTAELKVEHSHTYTFDALEAINHMRFCTRCGGSGRITSFGHVQAGICFKCGGAGTTRSGDLTIKALAEKVEADPKLVYKKVTSYLKRDANRAAKQQAAFEQLTIARQAKQEECLATLPEADRTAVRALLDQMHADHADLHRQEESGDYAGGHPFHRYSDFQRSLYDQFSVKGFLSEKQLASLAKGVRSATARQVAQQNAKVLVPGCTYTFTARVLKLEEVSVNIPGAHSVGTAIKVSMVGPNEERFSVKTNNQKLLPKFEAALKNNVPVTFTAEAKWSAPEGFNTVFSGRGMKVAA